MNSFEDTEICTLISRCRQRDDAAFGELVRRYTPMMNKVVSGFDNHSYNYSELFSEACVGLHLAVESFDLEQKDVTFGLFARACVYHKIIDLLRSSRSKLVFADVDVDQVSAVSGPETAIVKRERFESLLKEASELLSDYEYKVLMLHIQGYKTAKIAEMLSKSAKSVDNAKSRLFRRLRETLGSETS